MRACLTNEEKQLLESQALWFKDCRCVVRRTFIEIESEQKPSSPPRRARSLPPWAVACPGSLKGSASRVPISLFEGLGCKGAAASTESLDVYSESTACSDAVQPSSPRAESVSTTCSDSALAHENEAAERTRDRVRGLAQLVADECGFMKISGHRLCVARGTVGRHNAPTTTLCIFVHGLPWTKRAKWRQPLLRSAATALERANVRAVVTGGNLYVSLPGVGRVQLDFAAAR